MDADAEGAAVVEASRDRDLVKESDAVLQGKAWEPQIRVGYPAQRQPDAAK